MQNICKGISLAILYYENYQRETSKNFSEYTLPKFYN